MFEKLMELPIFEKLMQLPLSLKSKLLIAFGLNTAIILTMVSYAFIQNEQAAFRSVLERQTQALMGIIAENATAFLEFDTPDEAQKLLATLKVESGVMAGAIYRTNDTIFARYQRQNLPDVQFPLKVSQTPLWDPGTGILEVSLPITLDDKIIGHVYLKTDSEIYKSKINASTLFAVTVALIGLIILMIWGYFLIDLLVSNPLKKSTSVIQAMANGDLTQFLDIRSKDEVGLIADAINQTMVGIKQATGLEQLDWQIIAEQKQREEEQRQLDEVQRRKDEEQRHKDEEQRRKDEEQRRKDEEFHQLSLARSQALASASEVFFSISEELNQNATQSTEQAKSVSETFQQMNTELFTIGSSMEQMRASIQEINKHIVDVTKISSQAVRESKDTNTIVSELGMKSQGIGQVISFISNIAEQTKLLALNANIEAARAGEFGRGFAVVANEIKAMARDTSESTQTIGNEVFAIQEEINRVITAIESITQIIQQINDLQSMIASAVEEQIVTTKCIDENIQKAVQGSKIILNSTDQLVTISDITSHGAQTLNASALELAQMAKEI